MRIRWVNRLEKKRKCDIQKQPKLGKISRKKVSPIVWEDETNSAACLEVVDEEMTSLPYSDCFLSSESCLECHSAQGH